MDLLGGLKEECPTKVNLTITQDPRDLRVSGCWGQMLEHTHTHTDTVHTTNIHPFSILINKLEIGTVQTFAHRMSCSPRILSDLWVDVA